MADVIEASLAIGRTGINEVTIKITCTTAADAAAMQAKLVSDGLDYRRITLENMRFEYIGAPPAVASTLPTFACMDDTW